MNYYLNAIRKYCDCKGRASRKEYWMFVLINFLISLVFALLDAVVQHTTSIKLNVLSLLYGIAILCPALGLSIRRLHDVGRSGRWLLLIFVPFVGSIVLLVFSLMDSQSGANEYGPNPKELPAAGA